MPMNRVQFQPGPSMREFLSLYGTNEQREATLVQAAAPRLQVPALRGLPGWD
jgi:hypothetical protein